MGLNIREKRKNTFILLTTGVIAAITFYTPRAIPEEKTKSNSADGSVRGSQIPSLIPRLPHNWPPSSIAGHWIFTISAGGSTGYITGKAYKDNPKTPHIKNDGPEINNSSASTGPFVRWALGYFTRRGTGFEFIARLQITKGESIGYDSRYDAWIAGARILQLFYVRGQLNVLPFIELGYGKMRHIVENIILPRGHSGNYYRPSGNFMVGGGLLFLYRFCPTFNIPIFIIGDIMFPKFSMNLDVCLGLSISI